MNNKKKICFYIPSLNMGGAEKMMVILANKFSELNEFEVLFIVSRRGGFFKDALNANIKYICINKKRVVFSVFSLARQFFKIKPDIIISALGHANVAAVIANRICGGHAKVILTERSTVEKASIFHAGFFSGLYKVIYRHFYLKSFKVVAISQGVKKSLINVLGIPEEKITVINNPAYPSFIDFDDRVDFRKMGIEAEKIIISVGRLEPAKDFLTLLKAISLIKYKDIVLLVLGEGSQRKELEEYIANNSLEEKVYLLGRKKNPYPWLLSSDIYVCSSAWEGFGNSIVEAMACGLPIIATDCDGPNEILGSLINYVPVGSEQHLAQSILKNLELSDTSLFAERAREFSVDIILSKYLKLILADDAL